MASRGSLTLSYVSINAVSTQLALSATSVVGVSAFGIVAVESDVVVRRSISLRHFRTRVVFEFSGNTTVGVAVCGIAVRKASLISQDGTLLVNVTGASSSAHIAGSSINTKALWGISSCWQARIVVDTVVLFVVNNSIVVVETGSSVAVAIAGFVGLSASNVNITRKFFVEMHQCAVSMTSLSSYAIAIAGVASGTQSVVMLPSMSPAGATWSLINTRLSLVCTDCIIVAMLGFASTSNGRIHGAVGGTQSLGSDYPLSISAVGTSIDFNAASQVNSVAILGFVVSQAGMNFDRSTVIIRASSSLINAIFDAAVNCVTVCGFAASGSAQAILPAVLAVDLLASTVNVSVHGSSISGIALLGVTSMSATALIDGTARNTSLTISVNRSAVLVTAAFSTVVTNGLGFLSLLQASPSSFTFTRAPAIAIRQSYITAAFDNSQGVSIASGSAEAMLSVELPTLLIRESTLVLTPWSAQAQGAAFFNCSLICSRLALGAGQPLSPLTNLSGCGTYSALLFGTDGCATPSQTLTPSPSVTLTRRPTATDTRTDTASALGTATRSGHGTTTATASMPTTRTRGTASPTDARTRSLGTLTATATARTASKTLSFGPTTTVSLSVTLSLARTVSRASQTRSPPTRSASSSPSPSQTATLPIPPRPEPLPAIPVAVQQAAVATAGTAAVAGSSGNPATALQVARAVGVLATLDACNDPGTPVRRLPFPKSLAPDAAFGPAKGKYHRAAVLGVS